MGPEVGVLDGHPCREPDPSVRVGEQPARAWRPGSRRPAAASGPRRRAAARTGRHRPGPATSASRTLAERMQAEQADRPGADLRHRGRRRARSGGPRRARGRTGRAAPGPGRDAPARASVPGRGPARPTPVPIRRHADRRSSSIFLREKLASGESISTASHPEGALRLRPWARVACPAHAIEPALRAPAAGREVDRAVGPDLDVGAVQRLAGDQLLGLGARSWPPSRSARRPGCGPATSRRSGSCRDTRRGTGSPGRTSRPSGCPGPRRGCAGRLSK